MYKQRVCSCVCDCFQCESEAQKYGLSVKNLPPHLNEHVSVCISMLLTLVRFIPLLVSFFSILFCIIFNFCSCS